MRRYGPILPRHLRFILLGALVLLAPVSVRAQPALEPGAAPATPTPTPTPTSPPAGPSVEAIAAWIDGGLAALASGDTPPDEQRTEVKNYREAQRLLSLVSELRSKVAELERSAREAPARLEAIRAELQQPPADPVVAPPPDATLGQIEQLASAARAEVEAARGQVTELAAEATKRDEVMSAIPGELARLRQMLSELAATISAASGAAGINGALPSEEPARSQRVLQYAQRLHLEASIAALEQERSSYDARRALLPARRDLAQRRVTETQKVAAAWDQIVTARRQAEAEAAAREAERLRREAARQHPVLRAFADQNAAFAKELTELQGPTGQPSPARQADGVEKRAEDLRQTMTRLRERVDNSSRLSDATGLLLRRHYASMGDAAAAERATEEVGERQRDAEYRILEIDEERDAVGDDAEALRDLLQRVEVDPTPVENQEALAAVARDLIAARRDYLGKLKSQLDQHSEALGRLQRAYRVLALEMRQANAYIESRILWVRSVDGPAIPDPRAAADAARWLTVGGEWERSIGAAWSRAVASPAKLAGVSCLLLALVWFRFAAPRLLKRTASRIASFRTDRFSLTILALLITVAMSMPLPALLWSIAWFLKLPVEPTEQALAASAGLRAAGVTLLALILTRSLLRTDGLGNAHFSWHTEGVRTLRRHLRWFVPTIVALWGVVIAMDHQSYSDAYNDSLGRICFIGAMLAMTVFLARILQPNGAVLRPVLAERRERWIWRLRALWYPLAVVLPIFLIALTLARYYYTALRLQDLLFQTLWLIGALVLLASLMARWLFIVRRRLAIESARRRREQLRAAAEAEKPPGDPSASTASSAPPPPPAADMADIDIPALDSRMRQAVGTGIGLAFLIGMMIIWTDVLPALRMLDRVQLWPTLAVQRVVAEDQTPPALPLTTAEAADAPTSTAEDPSRVQSPPGPIGALTNSVTRGTGDADPSQLRLTLADLGLAIFIGVIAVLAVRNLPAVVELILLQHLPLDGASRYALVSVFRYALALIGLTATMGAIGISWTSVQWLAAALTFGLAFGLQEIFANFVSGLIILAERPVRVGDMVTVGSMEGTVTKIRMRATTILGWDRKELIIPNKQLITDPVTNWTLSDSVQRVSVPVGVAYGSDLSTVERVLKEACGVVPGVLQDPAPIVMFRGFGNSTLDWEARVFVSGVDQIISARTALLYAIEAGFRRENIEIAFPQLDLHLRESEPLTRLLALPALEDSPPKLD